MFGFDRDSIPSKLRTKLLAVIRALFASFDSYQPNRTYMRGAGPANRVNDGERDGMNVGNSS